MKINRIFGIVFLSVLLIAAADLFAQNQCLLRFRVSSVPVTRLSPADIDFENMESRNLLFTLNVVNDATADVYAYMVGRLDVVVGDKTYPNAAGFTTENFLVKSHMVRVVTNMDIGKNAEIKFLPGTYYHSDELERLVREVGLSTGKLPSGKYKFTLKLYCSGSGAPVQEEDIEFNIQNLSRVELRSPQDNMLTSEYPFFEFFYEGDRAELIVAEKNADQTREDAILRSPAMMRCELAPNQNSYLYGEPLASCSERPRPLEQGKTYVWRVVSKSRGIGSADESVPSQIYAFTVSASIQEDEGTLLLGKLREKFGQRFKAIFDRIDAEGLKFTKPYVFNFNNRNVTISELLQILSDIAEDDDVELTLE